MPKAAFYAVHTGRKPGVYTTWSEAEAQVEGFTGISAKFKKFPTSNQAQAFLPLPSQPYSVPSGSAPSTTSSTSRTHSPPIHAEPSALPKELRVLAKEGYSFTQCPPYHLVVYTDGSGLGNGKQGARAGSGVSWGSSGDADRRNLAERVPGERQTNNRGELLSVIRALEACPHPELPLEIRTDSQYTIMCMTSYLPAWIKSGFRTSVPNPKFSKSRSTSTSSQPIKNADMIKHLLVLLRRRKPGAGVRFKYVPGHSGYVGNEAADKLARRGAEMPALPERADWLDLEDEDGLLTVTREPTDVEVEIDESWLMTPDELDQFEDGFREVDG